MLLSFHNDFLGVSFCLFVFVSVLFFTALLTAVLVC